MNIKVCYHLYHTQMLNGVKDGDQPSLETVFSVLVNSIDYTIMCIIVSWYLQILQNVCQNKHQKPFFSKRGKRTR